LLKADNTATVVNAFYVCYFASLRNISVPGYERKETSKKKDFRSIVIEGVEEFAEIK